MAASGACEVVDEKKAKKMTKQERFLLKKAEEEKKLEEKRIEHDEKRREMLSSLPAKLRSRLESRFLSKAQQAALEEGKTIPYCFSIINNHVYF